MSETLEQRDAGVAGREMDARVAELVLGAEWYATMSGAPTEEALAFKSGKGDPGWSLAWRYSNGKPKVYKGTLPNYSCDVGSAYRIVEAMSKRGWFFSCENERRFGGKEWSAWFNKDLEPDASMLTWKLSERADADNLAAAICVAALKAIELDASHYIPS